MKNENNIELVIISSFFPGEERGAGPWSERLDGLYVQALKYKNNKLNKCQWYSISQRKIFCFKKHDIANKDINFFFFFLKEFFLAIFSRKFKKYLIAYPCFRAREIFKTYSFLILLAMIRIKSNVKIYIDFIDPLMMMTKVFIKRNYLKYIRDLLLGFNERIILNLADTIITNSLEMENYLKKEYDLRRQHFHFFPMGITVADFPIFKEKKVNHIFTIFYGGAISKDRGFLELFQCMDKVNQTHHIELHLCGRVEEYFNNYQKPWLQVIPNLTYKEYIKEICQKADVGIIPYPPNEWWSKASISKFATYAAAGLPILSTKLEHTEKFIKKWDCGFVAESWDAMADLIIWLANHENICLAKGENARVAAEKVLDWGLLSKKFIKLIN